MRPSERHEDAAHHGRLRVIFIVGYPRSGSTILGNILGELPGFFHVGEVSYLWERHVLRGKRYCACGQRVLRCPTWSEILSDGLATPDKARAVVSWRSQAINSWHLPSLLGVRRLDAASTGALSRYADLLSRLYERVAEVTGADTIVDSSKWPVDAAVVVHLHQRGISPQFIHLIRDPRAVIHSRQRRRAHRGADGRTKYRRSLIAYDAIGWAACNVAAEMVLRRFGSGGSALLTYERLASHPRESFVDLRFALGARLEMPHFEEGTIFLGPNHGLGGNTIARAARGMVEIRERREWVSALTGTDRFLASALTFPVARRYGYGRNSVSSKQSSWAARPR